MTARVDFVVFDEFLVVLITKGSQGIHGYMPNKVTDTTEAFNCNFSAFSSLKSPTCCTKPRMALDGNKLFLRQIICGFLGFIDNLEILFYERNKKLSRGCRLVVYTHLLCRYNSIITRDTFFIMFTWSVKCSIWIKMVSK